MSLVTLCSFLLFRNVDEPLSEFDIDLIEQSSSSTYILGKLKGPLLFSVVLSLLLLPLPNSVESLLGTKYLLSEAVDNFEGDHFGEQTFIYEDSIEDQGNSHRNDRAEADQSVL